MMKMDTGDGFPLRQGARTGSREVFGGYRGLRRRNSRSIFCSGSFRVRRHIWVKEVRRWTEGGPREGRARPLPRGQPEDPPTYFFLLYISIYPKNFEEHNRSGVPLPEASVATENQSRPVPAPCRRGESLSGGHLHHPGALHDEEGVVLPRG